MAGSKGNKNAEKWTVAEVKKKLAEIEAEAKKPTCLWLGSALVRVGLYRDIWAYWSEKFEKDEIVFRTIKQIEQIFEDRLFDKAAKGDLVASVAIFGLKNNHGWKDKSEQEVTIQSPVQLNDDL